jgi:glycosyltransferase involved in cell wall biosynthesis
MKEVGRDIDLRRVAFPGRVEYGTYLSLLQRSDAHVYLTYPFVLSWSLRESLAMGCAVVAADCAPVREFVTHHETGMLASFFDPAGLAKTVLSVIEDRALNERLRLNARRYAEQHLSMETYLAEYKALIARLTGQELTEAGPAPTDLQKQRGLSKQKPKSPLKRAS